MTYADHRAIHGQAPDYFCKLLIKYSAAFGLCCQFLNLLVVPSTLLKTFPRLLSLNFTVSYVGFMLFKIFCLISLRFYVCEKRFMNKLHVLAYLYLMLIAQWLLPVLQSHTSSFLPYLSSAQ